MDSFPFELVTPERLIFSGQVQGVVIPGTEGDFEVLAHHAPLMSTIRPGIIVVRETAGASGRHIFVRGGFADVNPERLTILAEHAVAVEDLSADRLSADIEAAEQALATAGGDVARAKAEEDLGQLRDVQRKLR